MRVTRLDCQSRDSVWRQGRFVQKEQSSVRQRKHIAAFRPIGNTFASDGLATQTGNSAQHSVHHACGTMLQSTTGPTNSVIDHRMGWFTRHVKQLCDASEQRCTRRRLNFQPWARAERTRNRLRREPVANRGAFDRRRETATAERCTRISDVVELR
jgi:hypothetical protein